MVDVPDHGFLFRGACSGIPIVDGITELAARGDLVFGNSESSGPFVLDTRNGRVQTSTDVDAVLSHLTPRPVLQSAGDFYDDRRWGRADAIAAALAGVPAVAASVFWYLWFIRSRASQRGVALF